MIAGITPGEGVKQAAVLPASSYFLQCTDAPSLIGGRATCRRVFLASPITRHAKAARNRSMAQHNPQVATTDEAMLRRLIDSVRDYAIFLLTPSGHVATWNAGAERLKGFTADEIIGRHFSVFYPPESIASGWPEEELRRAVAEGSMEDEGWRVRKDGSRFWANVVISPVLDKAGQLLGFSKVTRDLTERREHEQRLRASEQSLRLVVEGVRDHAMFLLAPDGTIRSWNSGARRVLGYRDEEVVGRPVGMLFAAADQEAGKPLSERSAARYGGLFEGEGWRRKADGTSVWMSSAVTLLKGPDGAASGFVQILKDLTERVKFQEMASEAERIHAFIAMLSHELRNPLAPIINAVQVLQRNPAEASRWVGLIGRQAAHLARLVDDLLDVSRITAGKITLELARLDLVEVVRLASEAARPGIEMEGQRLDLMLQEQPVWVRGDATRLTQVVSNLLSNAAKYTGPGGQIEVHVGHSAGFALLQVTDSGVGMSEPLLRHVFDPFVQGPRPLDRSSGGLGVGLTLVKTIVELHGGSVIASSRGLDRGSQLTVTLPPAPPEPVAGDEQADVQAAATVVRVLVVDDNRDAADTLAAFLEHTGMQAFVAYDGPSALALVEQWRPQLVLLDIGLPGMDGYQVARRIRDMPGLGPIRIFAVTGYGQQKDIEASRAAGIDHHVVKPIDFDMLARLVPLARTGSGH
jgi:PAS domain S-box-containing protein